VQAGSHAISVPVSLGSNTSVNTSFGTRLTISGNLGETTPGTSLTMTGAGKLTLAGSSNYTGDTAISSGTLEVNGPLSVAAGRVRVASGATLIAAASVPRAIAGAASDSAIVATAGNVTLGDSTSYTGFNHAGTLTIGSNAVTLNSAVFANLGVLTTLGGGTLAAPHGVYVGGGDNLVGSGVVSGKIAAVTGSTILATGNLTLGNSASSVGFNTEGELYTNANTVTLNDSNQAVLGSFTQIGDGESPGTLNAPNGIIVDTGKNLVGHGTMNSTNSLAKASIINGSVQATGSGLTLTGYIKGVGTYNGPVTFAGTYSPGLSPASVNLEDLILAPSSTLLMELGGMSPGSQYDVLNLSEAGMLDGTLEIDLIFGFMPSLGQTFDIINGTTTGHFSSFSLAPLPNGLRWNTSNLYSTGEISVVPEPSTLALFGVGGLGLMGWAWRRRTVKSKGQAREQERRDPAPHGKIPNPSGL